MLPVVDAESVRKWVERRLFELQGEEDEILVCLVLEEMRSGNLRSSLSSFLGKNTDKFVGELEIFARRLEEAQKAAIEHAETLANVARIPRRKRSGSL
jgi:hypothetical protein